MISVSILPTTAQELARAVSETEYKRLLSLPRSRALQGDLFNRANEARDWYAAHGNPFVAATRIEITDISNTAILLANGSSFHSATLIERLRTGEAHGLIALAATAGKEVAEEVTKHWTEGRPDEAFFLDRFATAVTEQLIHWSAVFLCREIEPLQETVLPHLSPGCADWDLSEQHTLMGLFRSGTNLGPIELLPSAALRPQNSVLAAMGVTHRNFSGPAKNICTICDLQSCGFRRAPYAKS